MWPVTAWSSLGAAECNEYIATNPARPQVGQSVLAASQASLGRPAPLYAADPV